MIFFARRLLFNNLKIESYSFSLNSQFDSGISDQWTKIRYGEYFSFLLYEQKHFYWTPPFCGVLLYNKQMQTENRLIFFKQREVHKAEIEREQRNRWVGSHWTRSQEDSGTSKVNHWTCRRPWSHSEARMDVRGLTRKAHCSRKAWNWKIHVHDCSFFYSEVPDCLCIAFARLDLIVTTAIQTHWEATLRSINRYIRSPQLWQQT